MKNIFFILALLATSWTFGQSMIVLKNGTIITLDKQGNVYDLGNFILRYELEKISGRFLFQSERMLRTLDSQGMMYSMDKENKVPVRIDNFGDNYFIAKNDRVFTVDSSGFFYQFNKDKNFRKVIKAGGNFFIGEIKEGKDKKLAFMAINTKGEVLRVNVEGLDLAKINYVGGRYFTTISGELFTVSEDGYVYSKAMMGKFNGSELIKGGNYFFVKNQLYLISDSGFLVQAQDFQVSKIKYFGTNFFFTISGELFTISGEGKVESKIVDFQLSDVLQFSHL